MIFGGVQKHYVVRFIIGQIMDTVNHMASYNFLAASSSTASTYDIIVDLRMVEQMVILSLVSSPVRESPIEKRLAVTHFDHQNLHILSSLDTILKP